MKRLVIDTATQACSVALFDDDVCVAAQHEVIGRGHAERLVPMIAGLPDKGRAQSICVNVGPGSFTGIRVGISAARALALAWQAECSGYGCLDLVAFSSCAHMSLQGMQPQPLSKHAAGVKRYRSFRMRNTGRSSPRPVRYRQHRVTAAGPMPNCPGGARLDRRDKGRWPRRSHDYAGDVCGV